MKANFFKSRFSFFPLSYKSLFYAVCCVLLLQGCAVKYPSATSNPTEQHFDSYYGSPIPEGGIGSNKANAADGNRAILRQDAPKRYTVKKGDTLWGISQLFLTNPAYWPEIWDKNQKVNNPHRIFPGDVLYIYHRKGSRLSKGKLVPRIRIERHGSGLPISTLEPFLMWPLMVDKHALSQAPYLIASRDNKLLIESDSRVYVNCLENSRRGDVYGIYNTGDELYDPETNALLGTEIKYHGKISVLRPDSITTAITEKTEREIRPGDRLIKVSEYREALTASMQAPTIKVRGVIISLYDAKLLSGQRMLSLINRGARDGLRAGHVVGIYNQPRAVEDPHEKIVGQFKAAIPASVTLPPERVGTMVLYSVSDKFSYGLITESHNAVKKGYKIGNP